MCATSGLNEAARRRGEHYQPSTHRLLVRKLQLSEERTKERRSRSVALLIGLVQEDRAVV